MRLVLDSDAHRPETLANQRWAVATARRAWLTAADVANTLPWDELRALRTRATQRGAKRTRDAAPTEPARPGAL